MDEVVVNTTTAEHVAGVQKKAGTKALRSRRRKKRLKYLPYQLGAIVLMIGGLFLYTSMRPTGTTLGLTSRKLEDDYETTCGTDFPDDGFTLADQRGGWIVIHVFFLCYMFVALAVVCDEYFVSALEVICETYSISDDVAGATFMAAGGSAPELFTSLIGVFVTTSDIGFGTIVGSAVFNVLFVIGLCAVVSGPGLPLTWYPLARDSTYYMLSLLLLAYFVIDNWIEWYEAIVMFALYLGYVTIMVFNERIKGWATNLRKGGEPEEVFHRRGSAAKKHSIVPSVLLPSPSTGATAEKGAEESKDGESKAEDAAGDKKEPLTAAEVDAEADDEDEEYTLTMPDSTLGKIFFIVVAPLTFLMFYTIPDCRKEEKKPYYKRTFVMSIVYIGLSSYVMVWMASEIGCTIALPESVMGITVLAAGTSIPDALSSMIVAREGHGDMAVSSSIGSNIFDICVGLPVPWLLNVLYQLAIGGDIRVRIGSQTLWISVATLLVMLICTVLSIHLSNWVLNQKLGIVCGSLYFVFIAQTLYLDNM